MTYSEKLKDPRWQRKRLEIMLRDDFTCKECGADDKTLNIHHIRYIKGREPWEYKNFYLITLCEDCHKKEEQEIKQSSIKPKPPEPNKLAFFDTLIHADPEFEENEEKDRVATPEEFESFIKSLKGLIAS